MKHLTAQELNTRLKNKDDLVVLDVREPTELATAALPGTLNIPMNEIPSRINELPQDKDVVVMCHHGIRSMQVVGYLERQGFENFLNLNGGIDAWSKEVDPSVPLY